MKKMSENSHSDHLLNVTLIGVNNPEEEVKAEVTSRLELIGLHYKIHVIIKPESRKSFRLRIQPKSVGMFGGLIANIIKELHTVE